jgi:hypothetical protein
MMRVVYIYLSITSENVKKLGIIGKMNGHILYIEFPACASDKGGIVIKNKVIIAKTRANAIAVSLFILFPSNRKDVGDSSAHK